MEARIQRLERLLTPRNARVMLVVLGALSLVFAVALSNVRLDHDFEKFFPTNDPELDRYMAFRERFGNDNDMLLVAASRVPSVFDRNFLLRFDSLAGTLGALPDVDGVTTPTRLSDPRITPLGVFHVPWLRLENDSTLAADSIRIWRDERVRNGFFAPDAQALLMVVQTTPNLSKQRSDALMKRVDAAVAGSGLPEVRMGGRIHGQYWYIVKMQRELILFFSISVVLLSIFLAVGFRTLWGVLVPIGVVGLTVLWQVGILTLLGKPLSILTMLLPTILFVVGMSDVVHILERYIECLRQGLSKARSLAVAYVEVGLATFLTSLTTAIGFATLLTSGIPPVRDFGVLTAFGVMLAFVLAYTLLPAVLLLVGTPVSALRVDTGRGWSAVLHSGFRWLLRHRRLVPLLFLALSVASIPLLMRLKVDNHLLEDWPEDDPQKQDYYWFERHFGGVRPFEVEVQVNDAQRTVWDPEVLRAIERVEQHLTMAYGVQAVISPVTIVKSLNKAFNGGSEAYYVLPDDTMELRRLVKRAELFGGTQRLGTLVSDDQRTARITARMVDEGGHVHRRKNAEFMAFLEQLEVPAGTSFTQTGMAYLIDRNNEKLSGQLITGLSIAFLLIAAIMAWVFRSWRMTLIALVPNIVPLLVVGGLMGLLGIDIKVSTSIIFTIAFGIAVDDTIHMLGKVRIELMKGRSVAYATKRAFLSTGKALVVTTIMLLSGFISLVFSDFASVYYMGLLVSITLAMALLADMLLLPVLVLWGMRNDRQLGRDIL